MRKKSPDNGLNEFVMNNTNSLVMAMDASRWYAVLLVRAKADAVEIEDFDRAKSIKAIEHELKLLGVNRASLTHSRRRRCVLRTRTTRKKKAESGSQDAMDRRM